MAVHRHQPVFDREIGFKRAKGDFRFDVSAYRSNIVNYTGEGLPEQLRAGQVSVDYFSLFGARTARGRTFSPPAE